MDIDPTTARNRRENALFGKKERRKQGGDKDEGGKEKKGEEKERERGEREIVS